MTETEHPFIKDGWFMEKNRMWPGQAMSLEVSSILHTEKSQYQDILIFESKTYGTVLVLDGVIQVTERDEFSYQEMIAHLPLFSHPKPENVLIVGGGDGGVAREVLKHPSVKRVVLCEIDQRVIELSKCYLPSLAISFKDPRVEVHIMDGAKFLESRKDSFDVVITDSSDPVGPAEKLFQLPYFQAIKDSLRDGGVMASQGECLWLHLDLIAPIMIACRQLFSVVEYAYTTIPTYPSGQIGFILCRKSGEASIRDPLRRPSEEQQKSLKYYNTNLHRAVFILPEFARRALSKVFCHVLRQ